jgi:hypothetical protein
MKAAGGKIRPAVLIPLSFLCALAFIVCQLFALFNTPSAVNALATALQPITGYRVHVDGIGLSSDLKGEISNLQIAGRGEALPLASFSRVEFKANLRRPATAFVEKIVLDHPRFRFVLKSEREETHWEGLDKLPSVQLLQIKDGEIDISGDTYRLLVTHLNVTANDFSSRSGGRAQLTSDLALSTATLVSGVNGNAILTADINFPAFFRNQPEREFSH